MTTRTRTAVTRNDVVKVLAALQRQRVAEIDADRPTSGPQIVEDFDWVGHTPWAIMWEEGPFEWTYQFPNGGRDAEFGYQVADVSDRIPGHLFVEPITTWAVGVYLA